MPFKLKIDKGSYILRDSVVGEEFEAINYQGSVAKHKLHIIWGYSPSYEALILIRGKLRNLQVYF